MSRTWLSHVTHLSSQGEALFYGRRSITHTYTHIHTHTLTYTHEQDMSHISLSHVPHMTESRHTFFIAGRSALLRQAQQHTICRRWPRRGWKAVEPGLHAYECVITYA